jgi:hypothetical protein
MFRGKNNAGKTKNNALLETSKNVLKCGKGEKNGKN